MLHILATALAFGASAAAAAADGATEASPAGSPREVRSADPWLNVNVYGFSYHTDRQGARRERLGNALNLGLGLNYAFHEDARGVAFVEAGFYRDSGSNLAKLAGAGYQFKLGDRWRLGAALLAIESRTYNHSRAFVAPIPLLTYDLGAVKLNANYAPRFQQYNKFAAFGLYFSIPFGK